MGRRATHRQEKLENLVITIQRSQGEKGNPQARGTMTEQVDIKVCTRQGKVERGKARAGPICTDQVQVSQRTRSQGQWVSRTVAEVAKTGNGPPMAASSDAVP